MADAEGLNPSVREDVWVRVPRWALLAVVLCAGCLPAPQPWTGSGPRVAMTGDSLMYTAENGPGLESPDDPESRYLSDAVGFSTSISTQVGATTSDLAGLSWSESPDVIVVALGSNDLRDGTVPASTALSNIAEHAARWPEACLITVEVAETFPWNLDETAPPFNDGLASISDVVVPWASIVAEEPELLLSDGVHHADEGSRYRAEIASAVNSEQCQSGLMD